MADRTVLLRLARDVARDVAAGEPGAYAAVAEEALHREPEGVLDLIGMLADEGRKKRPNDKLLSAYVYMIGRALEYVRYGVEAGETRRRELAEAVRQELLRLGEAERIEPGLFMLVLGEFSTAKLDPGPPLREMMARLAEHVGPESRSGAEPQELGRHLETLARDLEGDVFAFHDALREMTDSFPEEPRAVFVAFLLRSEQETAREAAIGWLLDASPEVRRAIAAEIEQAAAAGHVSGTMLRRLIMLRNWLPEPDRPALDRAIQAARRKDVACAAWTQPQVREVLASGVDGAGAQSIFAAVRESRRQALASLLAKQGIGVRDAWARHGLARAEMDEMLDQVDAGAEVFPIDLDYLRLAAAHALAVSLDSGTLPPFGMIDFAETAGLQNLQPEQMPLEAVLARLEAEADPALLRPEGTAAALAASRALPEEFGVLGSWFEPDDAEVAALLEGKRMARAKRLALVRDELLPQRRAKWAERLAWTALTLRHCEEDEPWEAFFVSARELLAGRPPAEIPLMAHVAEVTVDAYLATRPTNRGLSAKR